MAMDRACNPAGDPISSGVASNPGGKKIARGTKSNQTFAN
jgi:hypothetical protein